MQIHRSQIDFGNGGIATEPQQFGHDGQLSGSASEYVLCTPLPAFLVRHVRLANNDGRRIF
jgi:hypothetical protein